MLTGALRAMINETKRGNFKSKEEVFNALIIQL